MVKKSKSVYKPKRNTMKSILTIVDKSILKLIQLGRENWIKGADAKDAKGNHVSPLSKRACKFCNEGIVLSVLRHHTTHSPVYRKIDEAFREVVGNGMVTSNDNSGTIYESNLYNWARVREYLANLEKEKGKEK